MTQPTHRGSRRVVRNPTQREDCGTLRVCDGQPRQAGRSRKLLRVLPEVGASRLHTPQPQILFFLFATTTGAPRGPPGNLSDRKPPDFETRFQTTFRN